MADKELRKLDPDSGYDPWDEGPYDVEYGPMAAAEVLVKLVIGVFLTFMALSAGVVTLWFFFG